jgi:hypothetical protein
MTASLSTHLEACRSGSLDEVNAALRASREYLRVPVRSELTDILQACAAGLDPARGDATLALLMFLSDAWLFIPPGVRRNPPDFAAPLVQAVESTIPRLRDLRDHSDPLIVAWAWHLLSWMAKPVPGLVDDALARLPAEPRGFMRFTLAWAASSTDAGRSALRPLLETWLAGTDEDRRVAAMSLAMLFGNQRNPSATSDGVVAELLQMANAPRWGEWEAAPAREHGYFADLSRALELAGHARAAKTLPALLKLAEVCSAQEMEHVISHLLRVLYHSNPWPEDAKRELLNEAQLGALTALLHNERAWLPRPNVYEGLKNLGLPLGSAPLAALLGVPAPANAVTVKRVDGGTLTMATTEDPAALAAKLRA